MMYEVQKRFHYQFLQVDGFRTSSLESAFYMFDFHKKKGVCKQVWDSTVHRFRLRKKKMSNEDSKWIASICIHFSLLKSYAIVMETVSEAS